jgi:UDP:flavonoid glycosyltransferase YjiC (YdhE family)
MVHWDGAGNQPPQRALALLRRGHDVHVLSHDLTADRVLADGVHFHRLERAVQYNALDRMDPATEIAFILDNIWSSPAYAEDFRRVLAALSPDVCLVDHALATVLAEATRSSIPTGVMYHTIYGPDGRDRMVAHFTGRPAPTNPTSSFRALVEAAQLVMVFSYPAFSVETSFAPCVQHVGPIRERAARTQWPRCRPDRPFVLVSLNTSFMNQEAALQRICTTLSSLAVEVLVTTGPSVVTTALSPYFGWLKSLWGREGRWSSAWPPGLQARWMKRQSPATKARATPSPQRSSKASPARLGPSP